MKLWIGKEQEGKLKDINTLFVGCNSITLKDINEVLKIYTDITQVYFGAGGLTDINEKVVKEFVKQYPAMITTLEIRPADIPLFNKRLLRKVYLMITIDSKLFSNLRELDNKMYQIKLQTFNHFIGVGGITDIVDVNTLKGKMYDGDIIIER